MDLEYTVCPNCQQMATFLFNPTNNIGWCSQCNFYRYDTSINWKTELREI